MQDGITDEPTHPNDVWYWKQLHQSEHKNAIEAIEAFAGWCHNTGAEKTLKEVDKALEVLKNAANVYYSPNN